MPGALFGYSIESNRSLQRTRPGPGPRGRIQVTAGAEELLEREGELVSWAERDGVQFAIATSSADLLVWCSLTGSYLIRGSDGAIVAQPRGEHDDWEHRLGATIIPLALAERGDVALHAAGVVSRDRAVVFCGPPGRGKSTLAAALGVRGGEVLSDDGVVISGVHAEPVTWAGQAGVRIFGSIRGETISAGQAKVVQVVAPAKAARWSVPVAAIVLLAPRGGERPELERLDPVSALPALVPYALHGGPTRLPATMTLAARLVERVPVFRGRLPDDLAAAPDHAAQLLALVPH